MTQLADVVDVVWQHRLHRDPLTSTKVGRPVEALPGRTIADVEEDASLARGVLSKLDAVDTSALSDQDVLTASFVRYGLELAIEAPKHYWHDSPVAPYNGGTYFMYVSQIVLGPFRFEAADDMERYKGLVSDYGKRVAEVAEKVKGQVDRGILLPRPAIPGARGTFTQLRDSAPAALVPAIERVEKFEGAASFVESVSAIVTNEVVPAFERVLSAIGPDYEAAAPEAVGVGQYDGGPEFYRYAVRLRNNLELEPEQVHQIGLAAVGGLVDAMADARRKVGFQGSEAEFKEQLKKEPRLYAATPAEVEARYLSYMERLEPKLGELFPVLPRAPYGVERLAPELEPGMTYGYYEPPTPAQPVGRYRYNASLLDKRSLLNAAAIIYHELAPGHHFHIARQGENESLPDIRRHTFDFGAYNEGWAEYAAGLGWELGLYEDPLDGYGKLAHERFIAQRLVVDTGMNALGWSLDKARAYMAEHTFESDVQIATETVRYSTDLPAQALGYHLGHRVILACRARAEKALGSRFDIKEFHEAVLGSGSLPLPVLDEHVDRFIADR